MTTDSPTPVLVIGNKNYSSWSLRAWLLLSRTGRAFDEVRVALGEPGFREKILAYSPAGKVPILVDGDLAVWDSLAIAEYLAERHPGLWPQDPARRAHARAVSAEMHSGFAAVRGAMPMNCRADGRRVETSDALTADIERIQAVWTDCRNRYAADGPWLFGRFSIADAMYAPVVFRFRTYGVDCPPLLRDYMDTLLNDPDVLRWRHEAEHEAEVISWAEVGQT